MRHRLRASLVLCSLLVSGTLLQAAPPYQQAAGANHITVVTNPQAVAAITEQLAVK